MFCCTYLATWKFVIWNSKFCQILPHNYENFATKIEKFATFGHNNRQILQIKCTNQRTFFVPGDPKYFIDQKCTQKATQVYIYKKGKWLENINLIPKQEYQNLQREASKFTYTKYS